MLKSCLKCIFIAVRSSGTFRAMTFRPARPFLTFIGAWILVLGLGAFPQTPTDPVVIHSSGMLVMFLQFSPSGGELARLCGFGPVRMFDTANYHKARTFLPEVEHTPELASLAYSPDGKLIATAQGWSGALLWNAADSGKPKPEAAHFFGVDELYVLDTPSYVLIAPHSSSRGPQDPESRVDGALFSPDGKLLLTAHGNGVVKIWNTTSWHKEDELAVAAASLRRMAFAPDSRVVMVADEKGVLHEWSLDRKQEIRSLPTNRNIVTLQFSRDGKMLLETDMGQRSSVMIWDTADWSVHAEDGYSSAAFSPDGKVLALGGRGQIKTIEPYSRKEIRTFALPELTMGEMLKNANAPNANQKVPYPVTALAFSPDSNTLAVGGGDGSIVLIHPNKNF